MAGLDLTPNEFVGYRIKPDYYSFNVCVVKRHGPGSKKAGQEYEKTIAYCRTVQAAAAYIFDHALRVKAELSQEEIAALEGSVADVKGLLLQIAPAKAAAVAAVDELTTRLAALPLQRSELVKLLGKPEELADDASS